MRSATLRPSVDLEPRPELLSFVQRQTRDANRYTKSERRKEDREFLVTAVVAQPVDDQFQAIGEPLVAVSRDISSSGIGLVYTDPISANLLSIHILFESEQPQLVARVVWRQPMGPFYYIGCEYVAKLDQPRPTLSNNQLGNSLVGNKRTLRSDS